MFLFHFETVATPWLQYVKLLLVQEIQPLSTNNNNNQLMCPCSEPHLPSYHAPIIEETETTTQTTTQHTRKLHQLSIHDRELLDSLHTESHTGHAAHGEYCLEDGLLEKAAKSCQKVATHHRTQYLSVKV